MSNSEKQSAVGTMEDSGPVASPSNSDILKYLKRMDSKITLMDAKLSKLDSLEQKVSSFDSELKKLWTFVHDQFKENKDALSKVSERIDTLSFHLVLPKSKLHSCPWIRRK